MCVCVHACACVHMYHELLEPRGQKLDHLKQELQAVWMLGTKLGSSASAASALNCSPVSLAPYSNFYSSHIFTVAVKSIIH